METKPFNKIKFISAIKYIKFKINRHITMTISKRGNNKLYLKVKGFLI